MRVFKTIIFINTCNFVIHLILLYIKMKLEIQQLITFFSKIRIVHVSLQHYRSEAMHKWSLCKKRKKIKMCYC